MGKNFTDHLALDILLQIIEGIQGIHNAGLIHRDIKPVSFFIKSYLLQSNFVMGGAVPGIDDKN